MNKAETALIELARAQKRLKEINKQIGEALGLSFDAAEDRDNWKPVNKNKWLTLAYARTHDPYEGDYFTNHEEDVEGYLEENCQHALRAHRLIEERKPLKMALGVAKRRVTLLANRLARKAS